MARDNMKNQFLKKQLDEFHNDMQKLFLEQRQLFVEFNHEQEVSIAEELRKALQDEK